MMRWCLSEVVLKLLVKMKRFHNIVITGKAQWWDEMQRRHQNKYRSSRCIFSNIFLKLHQHTISLFWVSVHSTVNSVSMSMVSSI